MEFRLCYQGSGVDESEFLGVGKLVGGASGREGKQGVSYMDWTDTGCIGIFTISHLWGSIFQFQLYPFDSIFINGC